MHACVIAGTHSGVGKTTLTLGLLAALHKRGRRVRGFKVGPDFIDPGHHATITGTASYNLDGWMLSQDYNQACFARAVQDMDIGLVEGMMGVFDGYDGKTQAGSTAEMAKWLGLPVILLVDASAMARSVAALVYGFQHFDPELRLAGVIFNRLGGPGHLNYLREALEDTAAVPVLGGLPEQTELGIPERHLGLRTAEEQPLSPAHIDRLAGLIEDHIDLERLLRLAAVRRPSVRLRPAARPTQPRVRFGVARDAAFCFYYPDNLELLAQAGAELVFFSPLRDRHLPPHVQGLYFGGGYPELHAARLAANASLRREVRDFIERRGVVYAECGGLMYLADAIRDGQGRRFPMVGIYPTTVRVLPRLSALGYVEVSLEAGHGLFPAGTVRGHEFHYSELEESDLCRGPIRAVYAVRKRPGDSPRPEGYAYKRCLASYIHLHFGSQPACAAGLVRAAEQG